MGYDTSWDRIHAPGPEAEWQESDCYWFYDTRLGVGGWHRVGIKPNRGNGQLTLFVFAKDGERYTINDSYTNDRPVTGSDRWATGHRIGSHTAESLGDGRMRFRWDDPESTADIEFYESFHTPRGWSKTAHETEFMKTMNAGGHLECSGRIRGRVRIGEKSYDIDALAHRDRSWGVRYHSGLSYHRFRMFSGTVGPELSFATFALHRNTGELTISGYVVRNGVEHDITDLRVLNTFDMDGLTPVGGTAILTLENGEVLKVPMQGVQGFLTYQPEAKAYFSDNIMEVHWEGKVGFCDLAVGNNPFRGQHILDPEEVPLPALEPGLSRAVSYAL